MMRVLSILFFLPTLASAWTLLAPDLSGWQTEELTFFVNTTDCSTTDAVILDSIDRAISLWNEISTSNLVIKRGSSATTVASILAGTATDSPIITCDSNFSTNHSVNGNNIPGFFTRVISTNPLSYGAIILNAETGVSANIASLSELTLDITLVHEMGHALGLGHSSQQESMMYYSVSSKSEVFLSEDDMDGMSYLYPRNEFSGGMYGCAVRPGLKTKFSDMWQVILFWVVLIILNGVLGRVYVRGS